MLEQQEIPTILGVEMTPMDPEKLAAMPGIAGYVVQNGDTLWKIAKKFYASVDNIRELNEISGDEPEPGQRLLIVKQTEKL